MLPNHIENDCYGLILKGIDPSFDRFALPIFIHSEDHPLKVKFESSLAGHAGMVRPSHPYPYSHQRSKNWVIIHQSSPKATHLGAVL